MPFGAYMCSYCDTYIHALHGANICVLYDAYMHSPCNTCIHTRYDSYILTALNSSMYVPMGVIMFAHCFIHYSFCTFILHVSILNHIIYIEWCKNKYVMMIFAAAGTFSHSCSRCWSPFSCNYRYTYYPLSQFMLTFCC